LSSEIFGSSFHKAAMALSEEILQNWLPVNGSMIDIGCGTGRWCRVAAEYANRVVGVDSNSANIEIAKQLSGDKEIEYIITDITQNVISEQFDVALLIHVLEHMDNADSLLQKIHTIASTLIIEVPDFEADSLNLVRQTLDSPYYSDADHIREYTLDILNDQLKRNEWKINDIKRYGGSILAIASYHPASSFCPTPIHNEQNDISKISQK
ncbi:MAG: class I SAM-dependent methyltransferase, partial [Planktothrix sp.]